MKNILSKDKLTVSHTAEKLTAWRAGELTFGFGKMGIVNDLYESCFRQQWWQDKERTGSEKINSANKFLEDLYYKTKQKNVAVAGGSCEKQRLFREHLPF